MKITMIKLNDENNGHDFIDLEVSGDHIHTLEEMLELMETFMRACGFSVARDGLQVVKGDYSSPEA